MMKIKTIFPVLAAAIFLSGCVVYSFYPLYNDDDLFENDLLTGQWYDTDSTLWKFEHPLVGEKGNKKVDKATYHLKLKAKDKDGFSKHVFEVNIVELKEQYFIDFYIEDYEPEDNIELFNIHLIPVHTFAKLDIKENMLHINWFNQEWLENLIKQNKIRIHHESNDDIILLTAKPGELQKFVTKYVNSDTAFDDGLEAELTKKVGV